MVLERAYVVGRVGEGAWTNAPTEARLDQKAELAAVVLGKRGRTKVVLAPRGIDRVTLDGRSLATEPLEGRIRWSTVEPHGFRSTRPAANGATSDFYSNVSVEPASFGKWLGYDHIDYFERVVVPWGPAARIPAAVTAEEPDAQQLPGLGTVRYTWATRGW